MTVENQTQQPPAGGTPVEPPAVEPIKFDEWLPKQPKEIQAAFEEHVTGLKNTVKATRDERDGLAKQIKDLLPKAEKGSELEKSLIEFAGKLDAAEKRAAFFEDAIKPGIDCRSPKAAFILAVAENLFDRRGAPDWDALRKSYPELFGKVTAPAGGGNGNDNPPRQNSMNDFILRAAGRGR